MGRAVVCRGCGVRVKVPDGITAARARCPKCRTKITLAPPPAEIAEYLPKPAPEDLPPEEPLSLDDAEQVAPAVPFRFAAAVAADSRNQLRGDFAVVLMPHGLYLESVPNRPFLFAPLGTPAAPAGPGRLCLTLPDRVLVLELAGVPDPGSLAADTVAFLGGSRPVPNPADYRRPSRGHLAWKIAAAVGVSVAVAAGVLAAFTDIFHEKPTAEQVAEVPPEKPPPAVEKPQPPTPVEITPRPRTHLDIAEQDGGTRLDDGPADVTALAASPTDNVVVVGHADGSTRVWGLDRPAFDGPHNGPRADGPVRRVQFSADGQTLFLTCTGGFTAGSRDAPPRTPVKLLGELVAVFPEATAERFAALRGGKIYPKLVPAAIVKDPSVSVPVKGFVLPVSKVEVTPPGSRADLTPPLPKPTFLAWHPTGKLLAGLPTGEIVGWGGGALSSSVTKAHTAPVTAWADAGGTWDFATADAGGTVGVWANKSLTPTTFRTGGPVAGLALSYYGTHVAVLSGDAATVWTTAGERVAGVPGPTKAVAFGPTDDLLMLADGKGVRVVAWAK